MSAILSNNANINEYKFSKFNTIMLQEYVKRNENKFRERALFTVQAVIAIVSWDGIVPESPKLRTS